MALVVTARTIVVAPVANRALVEATLQIIDPSSVGNILVAPLVQAGQNTIAAYWSSWPMDATTVSALNQAFAAAKWSPAPSGAERKIYVPGDIVPAFGSQRMWLFDGMVYNYLDVLKVLGLAPLNEGY